MRGRWIGKEVALNGRHWAGAPLLLKKCNPFGDDGLNVCTDREKIGREGLRKFGAHLPRILHDFAFDKIYVLQTH